MKNLLFFFLIFLGSCRFRINNLHLRIHPASWDMPEVLHGIQSTVRKYGLEQDILPFQSVPLIIHHASCLADWIREIEHREQIVFKRYVSTIGWWPEALQKS